MELGTIGREGKLSFLYDFDDKIEGAKGTNFSGTNLPPPGMATDVTTEGGDAATPGMVMLTP